MTLADDLNRLPLKDRATFYRDQAVRATVSASEAIDTDARSILLAVAREWMYLADLCEGSLYQ